MRGLRLGRHRGRRRARHDHRRDRPLPHAADLEPPRCSPATSPPASPATSSRPCSSSASRCWPASDPHADPLDWLAAAGLLLALMTAISWLAACFGLIAKSVEAANAITFVAAFAPYLSQRVRPADTMPARPAVDRRAPAGHADRRHAARAAARHARRQRGDRRHRLVRRRDRDRPPRRRVPVRAPLGSPRGAQGRPVRHPPARDPQPAARRAGPARQAERPGPARHGRGAALPAAGPDRGRRPQPPAGALQPPRRVRRDALRASSPTSERALFEYWAHEAATCSARTSRSTATR